MMATRIAAMKIRPATQADLPQLVAISEAADSAAHWTRQQWLDIFHSQIPARRAWIAWSASDDATGGASAHDPAHGIGFLVAQCGSPEWELENMAVLPDFRRRGVGAALLSALLGQARARRAERVLLEVRVSNRSAIRLYEQGGFRRLARRPGYYRNPAEDALVLVYLLQN
jgi:[ribosomal protein S18]-alanine N-acetyltransferase